MVALSLTERQLNQVHMGLEARIEEIEQLIEGNRNNPAAVEDWELQLEDARCARDLVRKT